MKSCRPVVLVHGAWHGAWCWATLQAELDRRGVASHAIDLPGHGQNAAPISEVTMEAYVNHVIETAKTIEGPIILVGHSLAGAVISQVGERIPERIERLVYVAASLPQNGESVLGIMKSDAGGELLPKLVFSADQSYVTVEQDDVKSILLHDVKEPERLESLARKLDMKQATEPFMAAIGLTDEAFGSIPKTYVRASLDKVMSTALQDRMISAWKVDQVFTLESGHFPMMSMPDRFIEIISEIAAGEPATV